MKRRAFDPRILAMTAVMTAIVYVLTRTIQVPTPVVGYIHLGDIGVFFGAYAFGPWVGAIAGGAGTALADFTSPYAQWGVYSLLIHGAQAWVVGWVTTRWRGVIAYLVSAVAGVAIVLVGYLLAGIILVGRAAAITEVPLNLVQASVGAAVALPLFTAVRQAYPPILRFGPARWARDETRYQIEETIRVYLEAARQVANTQSFDNESREQVALTLARAPLLSVESVLWSQQMTQTRPQRPQDARDTEQTEMSLSLARAIQALLGLLAEQRPGRRTQEFIELVHDELDELAEAV